MTGGFIKLSRRIRQWGWYKDLNTFKVFMEIILSANFADGVFLGIDVKRGQLLVSVQCLASDAGVSYQSARTAVKHLISTGELTSCQRGKFTLFTVVNYEKYQMPNEVVNEEVTSYQRDTNEELTSNQRQYNNNNKNNNNKNNNNNNKNKSNGEERELYGRHKNVILSRKEYESLKEQYCFYEEMINKLSDYMAKTGKRYRSHYDTILEWAVRDGTETRASMSFDPDEFFAIALADSMRD